MHHSGAMAPREGGLMSREMCATPSTVIARESGRSSTPRPIGSSADASGILGCPVKPGNDGGGTRLNLGSVSFARSVSHPTEYFAACQAFANRPENWLETRASRNASGDLI